MPESYAASEAFEVRLLGQCTLRLMVILAGLPALPGALALPAGWVLPAALVCSGILALAVVAIRQPWRELAVGASGALRLRSARAERRVLFIRHRWLGRSAQLLTLDDRGRQRRLIVCSRGQTAAFRALALWAYGRCAGLPLPGMPNGHRSAARTVV